MSKSIAELGFFERVRVALDPGYLVRRAHAVYLHGMLKLAERAQFKAAESNRLTANWVATGEGVNTMIQREGTTMRNRSRYLLRNVPNAISGMNAFCSYCVGTGIRPIATVFDKRKVMGEDGKTFIDQIDNEVWNEECDDLWDEWSEDVNVQASHTSPDSFYDIQQLILRKWMEDGEAFVHAVPDKSNTTVPLYIEMFEPENLDSTMTQAPNGDQILMGVQLQKGTNRPVAYWIKRDASTKAERFDAKYIFHVFKRMRPGQVRGYPLTHGISDLFFQQAEYLQTELIGAKVASSICAFWERAPGMTEDGDQLAGTAGQVQDGNGVNITHMQPGMIGSVPQEGKFHVVQPQKPGATFGPFMKLIQRDIGSGWEYGLSYEALTRDTTGASYAGGRLALQRDYQAYRQIIAFLNQKFNTPFRKLWLEIAVTAAAIDADGFFQPGGATRTPERHWQRHEWIPPAWQYGVNPKDDVAASRDAMRAGMSTLEMECSFVGRDYRTVLRQQAKIKKMTERLGLTLTSDGAFSIVNGIDEPDDSSEEDGEKAANANSKQKVTA